MKKKHKKGGGVREVVRGALQEEGQRLGRELLPAVRPIVLEPPGARLPELVGSSVLLRFGARSFLVTAAHVVRQSEPGDLTVGGRSEGYHLPPLRYSSVAVGGLDPLDIAVCELPTPLVDVLGDLRYLGPADLDLDDALRPGMLYAAVGYPIRKQNRDDERQHFNPEATIYTGLGLKEREYGTLGCHPAAHVALSFDETRAVTSHGIAAIGHQNGLSGGGIFQVDTLRDRSRGEKLVGITSWVRRSGTKALVGTRIGVFTEAIRHLFPDVASEVPPMRSLNVNVSLEGR